MTDTTINLDKPRLSDFTLSEPKTTSIFVENQFPAIYRDDGRELIELVKAYYQFLEEEENQSTYNIRRIYEYRNIDSTLESMLVFFKNKFLNGLFFQEDVRFSVKNILDLYRRKGSKEGIELFFRLFFNEEVQTYFPSEDIFKPSSSKWQVGAYIQLYSVADTSIFDSLINVRIFGDSSKAEGTIDNIFFINVNNSFVPIIFLDNIKGEFTRFDNIYSLDPLTIYGRVYGSLRIVSIEADGPGTGGNNVGDIVEIRSASGFGAKGRVTSVSQQSSGEINFIINDGNYGYTVSNTDIFVSDQSIFFQTGIGNQFIVNEQVKQSKANTDVFATVLGNKSDSIGLFIDYRELNNQVLSVATDGNDYNPEEEIFQINSYNIEVRGKVETEGEGFISVILDKTQPGALTQRYFFEKNRPISTVGRVNELVKNVIDVEDDYFFVDGFDIDTIERPIDANISRTPLFVTGINNTARADIGTIRNTETIRIISDLIENFLDVSLDANNYSDVPPALDEMSGTKINDIIPTISTELNIAFVPETLTIGEIATLTNINPGVDHFTDVFVLAKENLLSKFNVRNQILTVIVPSGVLLFEGDIIQQSRTIDTFEGGTETVQVRGEIISVSGNTVVVKNRTFNVFTTEEQLFKQGTANPITITFISRDLINPPLGLNAIINGDVEDVVGKIKTVEIFDSGFGYEENSPVELVNISKENNNDVDAIGIASVTRQGITEGRWRSFVSHINREKVIQDSLFYQDYSYQITTGLNSDKYKKEYKEIVHPVGLKLFTKFGKTDVAKLKLQVSGVFLSDVDPASYLPEAVETAASGFNYIID